MWYTGQMTDILTGLSEGLTEKAAAALLIGSVIVALLQCFSGFRLIRHWVSFAGFVIGAYAGYLAARAFLPEGSRWYLTVLMVLVCGIVLGILAYRIFQAGLFLFCGMMAGTAVAALPLGGGGASTWLLYGLQIVAFLIAGMLAVRFVRTAVIAVSGIAGAWTAASGLARLLPQIFTDGLRKTAVFAVLAAAGILIQYLTTSE